MIDGSWLFAAVIFALVLVVIGCTALLEWALRRRLGPVSEPPARPTVTGTLPVIDGCGECRLAREVNQVVHHRHLLRDHNYHVLSEQAA